VSGKRSQLRNELEAGLVQAVLSAASVAPLGFSLGVARLLDLVAGKMRQSGEKNLRMAMPELDAARTVDGVYEGLGRMLYYFSRFGTRNRANIGEWIEYEGFEHYVAAKAGGKGVLFATGHLGNWELSAFAHALMTEPMNVVVRPLDNPVLDGIVKSYRMGSGNRILDKQDFLRGILRALGNNEPVGILIDQNTLPENGTFVDFFGMAACTGTTFAKLAHKTGAAVIPGYAMWNQQKGKYVLRFDPVFAMTGNVSEDTARLAKHFEGVIRREPTQWLWLHRRWKTRPAGESGIY
jgi:KDO2-lipid IV(A) lauroyltransferase